MQLYPYQEEGAEHLISAPRRYLGDEMGLGKSVQAAHAAKMLGVSRTLLIAPAATLENWKREWELWGRGTLRTVSWADRSLLRAEIDASRYDLAILDEAHYANNPRAQRTLGALHAARNAGAAMLLSGSPMWHPGHLWAPFRALWPEVPEELGLNSYDEWFRHFCRYRVTRYGKQPLGIKNAEQLRPHLKRVLLRRTLADVGLQLPPLRVNVSLLQRSREIAEALREYGEDPELALRRIAYESGPDGSSSRLRRYLGEWKAPYIAKQIREELDAGLYEKIVILPYHTSVLNVFREQLKDHGVTGIDGKTPPAWRQKAIDQFTRDPKYRVFVGQITAAGTGLNLQVANEIVLPEPDWNPAPNRQAIKRIHRIGSTLPCRARLYAVPGTIDDGIMNVLARKIGMQSAVL